MKLLIYLAIGLLLGYFMIPKGWRKATGIIQSAAMVAALFFMGVSLGTQPNLLNDLKEAGIESCLFALVTSAGSVLAVYLVERKFFRDKKAAEPGEAKEEGRE